MSQPIHYVVSETEFDLALLPKSARTVGSAAFRKHVTKYFRSQYANLGGTTSVEFANGNIAVTWMPRSADAAPMSAVLELLNAGQYDKAVPLLEGMLQLNPKDHDVLYNLGIVFSDQGKLDQARDLLRRAVQVAPDHCHSHVALGIAALRARDLAEGRTALERALALEPDNLFAQRTMGTLHRMAGDIKSSVEALRQTAARAPADPLTLVNLAEALLEQDPQAHSHEADELLRRVLELAPAGPAGDKARDLRRAIASLGFRETAQGSPRPDAVMYCLDALRKFDGIDQAELGPIVMEIATLGQGGLPVNDPEQRFSLRTLPGDYSALQLVCMLHVGIKMLDPTSGSGFDIDDEYAAALELHQLRGAEE